MLVVDDNATNRRSCCADGQVGHGGARHRVAREAVLQAAAASERFDLAILDMQMPEMDGVELAQRIRARRCAALPLVLFTSLGRREASDAEALFSADLTKPLARSQLFDALVSLLAQRRRAGAAVADAWPSRSSTPGWQRRHPLRILLAEDNVVNQKLALRLLQQMGYRADVAQQRRRGDRGGRAPALRRAC